MEEYQDAHEFIRDQAKAVYEAIDEMQQSYDAELIMTIEIKGKNLTDSRKMDIGLWSVDVCAILYAAFKEIEEFAKSQL